MASFLSVGWCSNGPKRKCSISLFVIIIRYMSTMFYSPIVDPCHHEEIETQKKSPSLLFYLFIVLLVNDCFVPLGVKWRLPKCKNIQRLSQRESIMKQELLQCENWTHYVWYPLQKERYTSFWKSLRWMFAAFCVTVKDDWEKID